MISTEDLIIMNESEYEIEVEKISIKEIEKNNKAVMEIEVDINTKTIYKVFCKKDQNQQHKDQSKLIFLSFQSFPDGIYLEVNDDSIVCHIYELKTSPVSSDKLNKISKQFLSAKFHLISLFSILEIDLSKIEFRYNLGYIKGFELKDYYNSQRNPKVITGQSLILPRHLRDWMDSKLSFNIGKHTFNESFNKLKMDYVEMDQRNNKYYKKEISL